MPHLHGLTAQAMLTLALLYIVRGLINLRNNVHMSCNSCNDNCSTGANKLGHDMSCKVHNEDVEAVAVLQVV